MTPWFTIERLEADTWAISEYGHWEETHCYLLAGRERALLIDTGLGVAPIRPVVETLTRLPVTAALTHAHWDHIGGLGEFGDTVCHASEEAWLSGYFPLPLAAVKANLLREPCDFPAEFDPEGYAVYQGGVSRTVGDGDTIDLGGRRLVALHPPGHSPGYLCWWEPERGTLYAGDLIYRGKLDMFYPTTDPVAFLASVRRVAGLPVKALRPGHHSLDVAPGLTAEVLDALEGLDRAGELVQGRGIVEFGGFSVHL